MLAFLLLACAAAVPGASYYCYKTGAPITVDGVLDEPAWQAVPWMELRDIETGAAAQLETRVRLVWDDTCLYVAFDVTDPDVNARMKLDEPEPRNMWQDQNLLMYVRERQYLELFLDPDADARRYMEFHLNAAGKVNDHWLDRGSAQGDQQSVDLSPGNLHLEWDCKDRRAAVNVRGTLNKRDDTDQGWTIELALPWASLKELTTGACPPRMGDAWRMLAIRAHRMRATREELYGAWPVLGICDAHQNNRHGMLVFSDQPAVMPAAIPGDLTWKMVWEWTQGGRDPATVAADVKALGFNAIGTANRKILDAAKAAGLETYLVAWFSTAPEANAQVLRPQEMDCWQPEPQEVLFQYGGESLRGDELYQNKAWCPLGDEVRAFGRKAIDTAAAAGYTGIALDGIGYRNYYACFCPACDAARVAYTAAHADLPPAAAARGQALEALVTLYADMAAYARQARPGMKVTCHVYPDLRSDPLYGNRLDVDYCGQTAAWFFEPHWAMEKVRRYADEIVRYAGAYHPGAVGAPLIGVYTMDPFARHRRDPERVRAEIKAVKAAGAQAIQFVELGHILNDPALAEVANHT
ncbi:MAG: carbohydrate-binding family 9-like protein [Planctomycetota bacterium]